MRKKTSREPRESALASGWTVDPDHASAPPSPADSEGAAETPSLDLVDSSSAEDGPAVGENRFSNAGLVLLGVFGALYLLYAWVWLSWAQALSEQNAIEVAASGSLSGGLQQLVFWLAPLAPILWFVAAFAMNFDRGIRRLVLWIVLGAIVLVPLPVFGGGGN